MQILKKRELSRKSELKQVLWSEPPILAGVSAAGGRDAGVKWTVKPEAACVRSECGEAEGSGRHRAGSSWGILSGTGCSPPWVAACPPTGGESPSLQGKPLPTALHIYRSAPLPAAAYRARALWLSPGLYSLRSSSSNLGTLLWGAFHTFLREAAPAAPCSGSGGDK